jgi:hypothetical protein
MEISGISSSRRHSRLRESCRLDQVERMMYGLEQPGFRAAKSISEAVVGYPIDSL